MSLTEKLFHSTFTCFGGAALGGSIAGNCGMVIGLGLAVLSSYKVYFKDASRKNG